jgi:hypothetical protein
MLAGRSQNPGARRFWVVQTPGRFGTQRAYFYTQDLSLDVFEIIEAY